MAPENASTLSFEKISDAVRRLCDGLPKLQAQARLLQPDDLEGQEWFELLRQKLVPQLGQQSWLVVAVVGGTNIGKSVIFNHLAGHRASATSPLASGTKHPVALVPEGFPDRENLAAVFPDFTMKKWTDAESALQETDDSLLFWRTADNLPSTLLVLDTPDIDSDARVNWVRADAVRRSADVLIAVLTQQKYNDAAVKEFFRKAGREDKAVLVVFNQCVLPDDEQYWPVWLETFCRETSIKPDSVYIAPADRTAAEQLRLPFFERQWPRPAAGSSTELNGSDPFKSPSRDSQQPRDLREDLSRLKFREIRIRTLRGSLQQLIHPVSGIPQHLKRLSKASEALAKTSQRLSADSVLKIRDWPTPANTTFVDEIRIWWKERQQGWAKKINTFYDVMGKAVLVPLRMARDAIQGEPIPPMDRYREAEWSAILLTVEEMFDKLQWMADNGDALVRQRMELILDAASRTRLIETLRQRHRKVDFSAEIRSIVAQEMEVFSVDSPQLFQMYRQLHNVSAAVRPMTSVVLFSLGMGPVSETVAPFVANAAASAVVHVVADVATGATTAVAGETAVSGMASAGSGMLQTWFHRLHSVFTQRRVEWLTQVIRDDVLGTLPEELQAAAELTSSAEYQNVAKALKDLQDLMPSTADSEPAA
ncbi:MAG: GTPase domain-containing protein [Planctomycetaceae bacterium]|nr:GTPase domain-containing protein [Planctomycetaceae bacterium]